ncbi:MAG TPA: tyrosine--tRNA ligase [Bacilli bacterium]|nr:tyrosine--tRNA ligase [Bacilli bacterium]HQC32568.1 tyrosine--tRNA ligase [Bacilli bacterium]
MVNIIDELNYRGLIKDYSDEKEIRALLSTPQTIYCGFDPSAASMHIGNFVMISLLMRLQRAGHRVIPVVGGATGMIGDPSGKSKERNLLEENELKKNTEAIRAQLARFINLEDAKRGLIVNNYDWLSKISMLDYLRDYGKYFPINYLLNKEIISSRLENGISYTEFSYNLLQAIDFLTLYRNHGCRIQVGGSDQWGNLTSGLELIRKVEGGDAKVGVMTSHLIVDSTGRKFGKSEGGALYLDSEITSPYKLYQYFINVSDADAIRYLKVFTFLSREEIETAAKAHEANPGLRQAQKTLAYEVVKIIHGQARAEEAIKMSESLFSGDFVTMSEKNLIDVLGDLEVKVDSGIILEDVLIAAKAATSKREAREFLKGGSIAVNGQKAVDGTIQLTGADALHGKYYVLRRGKKNYYLINVR